jgi:hypothetical protein
MMRVSRTAATRSIEPLADATLFLFSQVLLLGHHPSLHHIQKLQQQLESSLQKH